MHSGSFTVENLICENVEFVEGLIFFCITVPYYGLPIQFI